MPATPPGLITAIPGIVLGARFLYGTPATSSCQCRIVDVGVALIVVGSLLGLLLPDRQSSSPARSRPWATRPPPRLHVLATGIADPKRRSLYVGLMCAAFRGTAISACRAAPADISQRSYCSSPGGLAVLPIMGRRAPPAPTPDASTSARHLPWRSSPWRASTPAGGSSAACTLDSHLLALHRPRLRPLHHPSFFTNVPWALRHLIVNTPRMNFTVALMNGIGAAHYGLTPARHPVRLCPPTASPRLPPSLGPGHGPHGRGATVRGWVSPYPVRNRPALFMSSARGVITAAMCLIYAGFGALFHPPSTTTVFATVALARTVAPSLNDSGHGARRHRHGAHLSGWPPPLSANYRRRLRRSRSYRHLGDWAHEASMLGTLSRVKPRMPRPECLA